MQQWGRNPEKQYYRTLKPAAPSFKGKCLTDQTQDEIFTHAGACAYRAGRFEDAIKMFGNALNDNPKNATALLYVGMMHAEFGDYDAGIRRISESIAINPCSEMAYAERAEAYFLKGDIARAKEDSLRSLELNPDYADAYALLGSCRSAEGRHAEALLAFSKYCELKPADAEGNAEYKRYQRNYLETMKPRKKTFTINAFVPGQLPDGALMFKMLQVAVEITYGPKRDANEA